MSLAGLGYVVNNHGDHVRPQFRCGTPSKWPNSLHGLYMGVILTTYKSWDDPPSTGQLQLGGVFLHPKIHWMPL